MAFNLSISFSHRQVGLHPVTRGRAKRPNATLRPPSRPRGRPDPEEPGRPDADRPRIGRGREVSLAGRDAVERRSADDDKNDGRRLDRKFGQDGRSRGSG